MATIDWAVEFDKAATALALLRELLVAGDETQQMAALMVSLARRQVLGIAEVIKAPLEMQVVPRAEYEKLKADKGKAEAELAKVTKTLDDIKKSLAPS